MTKGLSKRYPIFDRLIEHKKRLSQQSLLSLFEIDSQRASAFSVSACGLMIDFSKNILTKETLSLFSQLLDQAQFDQARNAMFAGEIVNHTEQRKVLHTSLRSPHQNSEEEKAVHEALTKMETFVEAVQTGHWKGFSNKRIEDVVNIGIGGSDLGPRMACQALEPFRTNKPNIHFVANIDGADIDKVLKSLNPETTLFIIASKSFTTLETLENGKTARTWLLKGGCSNQDIGRHFVAITANNQKAIEFGIEENNCFPMWDWVGGRYSLWSAIGLPIALKVGMKNFRQLLAGAHEMDTHFREAPLETNLPLMQALLVFWYNQCWQVRSQAILPYNHHLGFFPAYLQQLDMESLGKSCDREGNLVDYSSGIVVWGTEGTNGQHSFHQLLHQGTDFIPADFIISRTAHHEYAHQQQHLIANCLSQSQALMCGKTWQQAKEELLNAGLSDDEAEALAQHKVVPGNRPSTTIVLEELDPKSLGTLIALYEHKIFSLSVLYNINAFDQWGVELGKQLSGAIFGALDNDQANSESLDPSTRKLLERIKK